MNPHNEQTSYRSNKAYTPQLRNAVASNLTAVITAPCLANLLFTQQATRENPTLPGSIVRLGRAATESQKSSKKLRAFSCRRVGNYRTSALFSRSRRRLRIYR